MKPIEMAARLMKEFPGRPAVSFEIRADNFPGRPNVEMKIYDSAVGHVDCLSLEDGIAKLKERLATPPIPVEDVDLDIVTTPTPEVVAPPVGNPHVAEGCEKFAEPASVPTASEEVAK